MNENDFEMHDDAETDVAVGEADGGAELPLNETSTLAAPPPPPGDAPSGDAGTPPDDQPPPDPTGLKPIEAWAEELGTPPWLFAGLKLGKGWAIGQEVTREVYEAAAKWAANVPCQ